MLKDSESTSNEDSFYTQAPGTRKAPVLYIQNWGYHLGEGFSKGPFFSECWKIVTDITVAYQAVMDSTSLSPVWTRSASTDSRKILPVIPLATCVFVP